MKILVTGASGKVGKHVIKELEAFHELRLFSRTKVDGRHPHVQGDLLDAKAVRKAVEGVDAVAHLGANPWNSPDTFETNVMGTWKLLEACKELGVMRVVSAGSDWGIAKSDEREERPDYTPVDEAHPCRPTDNYGLSKVVCEQVSEWFAREQGMTIAVLRITSVWDPESVEGFKPDSANLEGAAKYWWSYVDARDVARAFRLALEKKDLPRFGTYIISAKDSMLAEDTQAALQKRWPGLASRAALSANQSILSLEAAKAGFGWEPIHSWKKNA